ncbi:hypothetical protein [Hymenobacter sp.]|uniref:hypothetical protein n=1 Tax=Hymenobacter sp. TaxID=1898978 RepID=UPI002EDB7EBE
MLHNDVNPDYLFDRMSEAAARAVSTQTACFDGYYPTGGIGHLGAYPQATFRAGRTQYLHRGAAASACASGAGSVTELAAQPPSVGLGVS